MKHDLCAQKACSLSRGVQCILFPRLILPLFLCLDYTFRFSAADFHSVLCDQVASVTSRSRQTISEARVKGKRRAVTNRHIVMYFLKAEAKLLHLDRVRKSESSLPQSSQRI